MTRAITGLNEHSLGQKIPEKKSKNVGKNFQDKPMVHQSKQLVAPKYGHDSKASYPTNED